MGDNSNSMFAGVPEPEGYIDRIRRAPKDGEAISLLLVGSVIAMKQWWVKDSEGNSSPRHCPLNQSPPQGVEDKVVYAFGCLDLGDGVLKYATFHQATIKNPLYDLSRDPDVDLTKSPVKISCRGAGKNARYGVMPLPPAKLTAKQKEELKTPFDLELLYEEGGRPFDLDGGNLPF